MKEWFADEAFWKALYPYMFTSARFDAAAKEVAQICTLAKFKRGTVLDLCCGPARHCVEPARCAGVRVTGVDKSRFLLSKANVRARQAGAHIEFVRSDMRDFVRPESFDLVINMFTAFGYFDNKDEDLRVLENIHGSLKVGGRCVIDVEGKEWLARVFQPSSCKACPDGSRLVQRREIYDEWSRIRNEWILIKNGKATAFKFHHTGIPARS